MKVVLSSESADLLHIIGIAKAMGISCVELAADGDAAATEEAKPTATEAIPGAVDELPTQAPAAE